MIFSADKLKESISTFFDGVKGDEVVMSGNNQENEEDTGFLFEATGSVINFSLSWESIYSTWETLTGEQIVPEVTNTPTAETTNTEVSEQKVEQPVQAVKEEKTETTTANNPTSQVTIIEAIKHLVKAYNIPLSKSTSSKFTHVSKSSSMYPYMKTALEKRMIWTTTDPNSTEEPTIKFDGPTELPKTGKNLTIVLMGIIIVTILSLIIFKKYNNYKDIK